MGFIRFRFRPRMRLLRALLSGWSFSETAFLHSGLPFTVLSQPYTANGNGIFQSSGPQFARARSRRAALPEDAVLRRDGGGDEAMAESGGVRFRGRPDDWGLHRRRLRQPIANLGLGAEYGARAALHVFGYLPDKRGSESAKGCHCAFDTQMFNAFNHPNFALPSNVEAGVPGVYIPAKFGTLEEHNFAADGIAGRGSGRGQFAAHDCISGKGRVLISATMDAMQVLSAAEMQACDRVTTERYGVASLDLMRAAAAAVAAFAREQFPQRAAGDGAVRPGQQRRRWDDGRAAAGRCRPGGDDAAARRP